MRHCSWNKLSIHTLCCSHRQTQNVFLAQDCRSRTHNLSSFCRLVPAAHSSRPCSSLSHTARLPCEVYCSLHTAHLLRLVLVAYATRMPCLACPSHTHTPFYLPYTQLYSLHYLLCPSWRHSFIPCRACPSWPHRNTDKCKKKRLIIKQLL